MFFLVADGKRMFFCKGFKFVMFESVCFGKWWTHVCWVVKTWTKVSLC